jgi:hypothetical protein
MDQSPPPPEEWRRQQKGAGIAASPRVTGLRLLGPEGHLGLVSAACSTRAGKGMRASRRSSRPVRSPLPKELRFPDLGGPLHYCRGQQGSLAGRFLPTNPKLRAACAALRSWHPVRLAPSLPPGVYVLLAQPFRTRPIGAIPGLDFVGRPKVSAVFQTVVSSWLCSGFPRRHRLLTVMKLSLNRGRGKREMGHLPC